MSTRTKRNSLIAGTAAAAVLASGAIMITTGATAQADAPARAAAPEPNALVESKTLSVDEANKAAQATLDAAEKDGQRVSVAVVDRSGNVQLQIKGNGAGPQSMESAERKAYTSVAWAAPTSELAGRISDTNRLQDIPGTLFLAGAVPVAVDKAPVAGIGVAGAPSGDLDEKYAKAGLAAISSDLQ